MRIMNNARIRHDSPNPPLGVRFRPDDQQLIRYLIKFVASNNYVCKDIPFEDLYGSKKPWELLENSSDTKYFFTQLKKIKPNHTNFIRTLVGGGSWKGKSKVESVGAKKIGTKRSYNYEENKKGCKDKVNNGSWIMKEYSLDEKIIKSLRNRGLMKHEDVVLCYIKCKDKDKESRNHMSATTASGNDDNDDALTTPQQDELQKDQNSEQVMNQVQNREEDMVPLTEEMMNNMATHIQPQWPICADESGYLYQLPQQIVNCPMDQRSSFMANDDLFLQQIVTCPMDQGSSAMMNEGNSNAELVVPDQLSTYHKEHGYQMQNTIESGYGDQLPPQMVTCPTNLESSAMMNEGNNNAELFVPDQLSTYCEEQGNQMQNIIESGYGDQFPQQMVTCPMYQGNSGMVNEGNSNAELFVPGQNGSTYCVQEQATSNQMQNIIEYGYGDQFSQQMVTCPMYQGSSGMINEGNSNAPLFVSDQLSTYCEEQGNQMPNIIESGYGDQLPPQMVTCPIDQGSGAMMKEGNSNAELSTYHKEQAQNVEETTASVIQSSSDDHVEPTLNAVLNNDDCFSMNGLVNFYDVLTENLSWDPDWLNDI